MDPFLFFYDYVRCGLWASSGPFPLSAHYGLYKRGRDPPTNPSRHLKKKECSSLKWLLKEDQGRRPTAASAAATAAAPPRAAAVPAAETAASPCLGCVSPACSLPAAAAVAAASSRRRKAVLPPFFLHHFHLPSLSSFYRRHLPPSRFLLHWPSPPIPQIPISIPFPAIANLPYENFLPTLPREHRGTPSPPSPYPDSPRHHQIFPSKFPSPSSYPSLRNSRSRPTIFSEHHPASTLPISSLLHLETTTLPLPEFLIRTDPSRRRFRSPASPHSSRTSPLFSHFRKFHCLKFCPLISVRKVIPHPRPTPIQPNYPVDETPPLLIFGIARATPESPNTILNPSRDLLYIARRLIFPSCTHESPHLCHHRRPPFRNRPPFPLHLTFSKSHHSPNSDTCASSRPLNAPTRFLHSPRFWLNHRANRRVAAFLAAASIFPRSSLFQPSEKHPRSTSIHSTGCRRARPILPRQPAWPVTSWLRLLPELAQRTNLHVRPTTRHSELKLPPYLDGANFILPCRPPVSRTSDLHRHDRPGSRPAG